MKAKLIKKDELYFLEVQPYTFYKPRGHILQLSLKNCQAIERGYDLDELSENKWNELSKQLGLSIQDKAMWCGGFKHGLLELLGDKKFSEEDMINIYILGGKYKTQKPESFLDRGNEIIQSLQQTKWDVDIVQEEGKDTFGNAELTWYNPKLDADGCLILKRAE